MQDSEQVMEMEESPPKPGSSRPRTKKKSTLAKLKERKQREQSANSQDGRNENSSNSSQSSRLVASPSDDNNASKPRPKPRSRGLSSQVSTEDKLTDSEKRLERAASSGSMSDSLNLQRFKNLKMSSENQDCAEDFSINKSNFVPKPPVTPRTPGRTPRGYVLPGKGEKRNRENGHSSDEPEVEEKKKNSSGAHSENRIVNHNNSSNVYLDIDSVHPSDGAINSPRTSEGSRDAQCEKNGKLLKRRNSLERTSLESSLNNDSGKPPVSRNGDKTVPSRNIDNLTPRFAPGVIHATLRDPSPHTSPRDRYSRARSRSISPSIIPRQVPMPASSPAERQSRERLRARPMRATAPMPSGMSDTSEMLDTNDLTRDAEGSNKSTQVLFTSDNPQSVRSISTPPLSARLSPISPRSHPPPLTEEFSSHSLRTSYKIDPGARPASSSGQGGQADKSDSGNSADRLSQKSFQSASVLPVITTKEARSRLVCVEWSQG